MLTFAARTKCNAAKAFVIGVAALTVSGCSLLPHVGNEPTRITADFDNIAGVYVGNPVTVLGLEVGRVERIVAKSTVIEVHLSIKSDVKIPKDAMAVLISPSIVTDRHIELTPVYTHGEMLADGAHLPKSRTKTPVELDTLIQTIDRFTAALKPQDEMEGSGPLSGRVLHPLLEGNGTKIRDTLQALSSALKVGTDNKDAVSNIIIRLNELTSILAENDRTVRDFSDKVTQMNGLLAEQAPGLQATLEQLSAFLANTSGTFGQYQQQLADSLSGLTKVTDQLRANAYGLTEVVDLTPMVFQNIDNLVDREHGHARVKMMLLTALNGEIVSLFCERIQMKADGCRTGNMQDFGPDYGLTAALLGLTK
ncbi:MlaD family protein [Nocardia asiatica]|uniref:MlaD family protein n=1 Tax=Nocardia asiatica TaxID=209252 RepID=UPI0003030F25|nr:MlaD family protein [Nocardia asiatica]